MKTKITLLLSACFMLIGITLSAQAKLGDNPTDVNANALLELESTSQGVLFPRMSSTDRDSVFTSDVPNGLLIYNTTEDCLQVYNGTQEAWNCVSADSGTASVTESYQQLSINRHIISLSNGGSVAIPVAPDNQTLSLNGIALSIRQGNTVDFSPIANTDSQTLSLTGDVLEISGINSVSLDNFIQDIVGSSFNTASNLLAIAISNGASQTTSFATLGNTTVEGVLTVSNTLLLGLAASTSTTYRLEVEVNARVSGEIYETDTVTFIHPDYVFESYYDGSSEFNKDYALPTLEEVENFVKANKHLPGVQSRADIDVAGRSNISENIRTNLEKVEELYLHTIAQEKEIEALKAENTHYKKTMKTILERLEL